MVGKLHEDHSAEDNTELVRVFRFRYCLEEMKRLLKIMQTLKIELKDANQKQRGA